MNVGSLARLERAAREFAFRYSFEGEGQELDRLLREQAGDLDSDARLLVVAVLLYSRDRLRSELESVTTRLGDVEAALERLGESFK